MNWWLKVAISFLLHSASQQLFAMGDRGTSNYSEVTDFILVSFRVHPELHILLFLLFLLIYTMIFLGNIGMMVINMTNPRLNTPMYFFLGNLSFIDLFYSSVIAPKAMSNSWSESKSISFAGCISQFFLFALFSVTEGFILAIMAYYRFIVIRNPFLYTVQMSTHLCVQLVAGSYFFGCISSVLQTSITFTLSFCASRTIDHFVMTVHFRRFLVLISIFISWFLFSYAALSLVVIIVSYIYILYPQF